MRLKKSSLRERILSKILILLPPLLLILYVGHSISVIRDLLSESTDFHLNYANNLVQEYFQGELTLQLERLQGCLKQDLSDCPDTPWLQSEPSGPPIANLPDPETGTMNIYLDRAEISHAITQFVAVKQGLAGLISAQYHEPVYWFNIKDESGTTIFQSGPDFKDAKGRKTYSMDQALPGHSLQIAYNSFGAQQLFSVASKRINFALIFLLFVLALLSLALVTRSLRQKFVLAKQKAFFVSTVSHEFKTPLAIMKLASETLVAKRYSSEKEAHRFLRMISNEINHLNHLVHKILSYNKIELDQVHFHEKPMDLIELLKVSRENYTIRAEAENMGLNWNMPKGPCWILGDAELIRHAVDNVLDNAFKYRGTSKVVHVNCQIVDDAIHLSIQDEGVGIAEDEHQQIFKSFYRVSDPSTEGIRGSGLGLAISRYILDRCQATLNVQSMLGKGATFTIKFPIHHQATS